MAVQVPQLQRFEPTAPASSGQISTQVVDEVRPMQQVSNVIEGVGNKAVDLYQKAEDDYAHTKSTEIANSYNNWVTEQINGTKDKPGLRHLKETQQNITQLLKEKQLKSVKNCLLVNIQNQSKIK
jgi:hypothetical protein